MLGPVRPNTYMCISEKRSQLCPRSLAPLLVLLVFGSAVSAQALEQTGADFFESKVRPLLAERCQECHEDQEQGGLRMDSREALLKGGTSGPAIIPGKPEQSLLIQAVRHTQKSLKMPDGRAQLSKSEIGALETWILEGAVWPKAAAKPSLTGKITPAQRAFWSFQPIRPVSVPKVKNVAWSRTDLDRFVLARLEKEGLQPVKPAEKRDLLRRVTLALTGLPPTPEEFDSFLKDPTPDAFAQRVDRLLGSVQFGEAWGRLWLDVARFADDDPRSLEPDRIGYMAYPNAYLYRDWVVGAFNEDLPYDRFIKAQLAGDLLEGDARAKALPALGFLGLGPWSYDNSFTEVARATERNDRVDVVGRGLLGLTVACARCHDHKYDPILATDYYAIAGVFGSTVYKQYPLVPQATVDAFLAREGDLEDSTELYNAFLAAEASQLSQVLVTQTASYVEAVWRVKGPLREAKEEVVSKARLDPEMFDRWVRFLAKPPTYYPFLKNWQAMMARGGSEEEAKTQAAELQALFLEVFFQHKAIKAENDIIRAKAAKGTQAKRAPRFPDEFLTNDDFCPGCDLNLKAFPTERALLHADLFEVDQNEEVTHIDDTTHKPGLFLFRDWGLIRRLPAERQQFLELLKAKNEQLKNAVKEARYVYVDGVADVATPVNLRLDVRGNPFNLGEEVPRGFLTVLGSGSGRRTFQKGSGRLELAESILESPISTRVIVNRVWRNLFGTGLVNTPSNLGVAGERPSHPELLEHLSHYFLDNGRSFKKLIRYMVTSSVYQLSVSPSKANAAKDGSNRLYWRANRRRLTAEQLRDSVLFVSGTLDDKRGGPSEDLMTQFSRRALYGKVSRYELDRYLRLFDFPSALSTSEHRFATNVPLQRLYLLNSEFIQRQGELLGRKLKQEQSDDKARLQRAFQLFYGRSPEDEEARLALEFLRTEPSVKVLDAKFGTDLTLATTVWGRLLTVLFNSNEFLYVN
jgi:hypothetical protein